METFDKNLIQKNIENLKQHIKANHSNLSNIKVFEGVEEVPFVIKFTQFSDYDINLTLQINSDSNLSNSTLILSHAKQAKNNEKKFKTLEDLLTNKLKEIDPKSEKFLIKFFEKGFDFVEKNFEKYQSDNSSNTKKVKEPKQSKLISSNESVEVNTKKSSMKTAHDVVNRIQWDEEINKDFIIVGYLDRFLGIKECMFNTFDWGDIVLAELGALAIPEHRIVYFKYKNEVIWDKKARLDNIFGSTGSKITIYDVIKRLENEKFESISNDDTVFEKSEKDLKEKPNFFISIPINNDEIKSSFLNLTNDLLHSNNELNEFLIPSTALHLTVCTLRINTEEEMELIKSLMNDLNFNEQFLEENFPINLKFKGIGDFYNKVLYVDCQPETMEKLQNLKKILVDVLEQNDVSLAGNYYEFVPHLTVFKIKNKNNVDNEDLTVKNLVDKLIWRKYENFNFGEQNVKEIELCKMVDIFNCQTFPVEYTLNFNIE